MTTPDAQARKLADPTPTRDGRWRLTSHVELHGQRYVVSSVALWREEDTVDDISPRLETRIWPADENFITDSNDAPPVFQALFSSEHAARINHMRHVTNILAGKTWETP